MFPFSVSEPPPNVEMLYWTFAGTSASVMFWTVMGDARSTLYGGDGSAPVPGVPPKIAESGLALFHVTLAVPSHQFGLARFHSPVPSCGPVTDVSKSHVRSRAPADRPNEVAKTA